jgi:3-deoxy-manno-octulosonate cytidylyltransferase (CMP-KDO synthetase)
MTSPAHPAATDRVAEAARLVDCTHVVNVQGDEILVLPSDLRRMVEAMTAEPDVCAWNAVARLEAPSELSDQAIVKCVVSVSGRILYCARDFSHAAFSDQPGFGAVRAILGILGYRRDFLGRYAQLRRTPIEEASAIDQSRIIEHDIALRSVEFSKSYRGINEPREVELVQACLDDDPAQHAVLREIAHT